MRWMRGVGAAWVVCLAAACGGRFATNRSGEAPEGVYVFEGVVEGETVSGTIDFEEPILLSSSHGRCTREIRGHHRWGGRFTVGCPAFRLTVDVADDGSVRKRGVARLLKRGWREERRCERYSDDTNACVAWVMVVVPHDRWFDGRVTVEPRGW